MQIKKISGNHFDIILNLLIRIAIIYFLLETIANPNDPRFAGKAIVARNIIIISTLSLLVPAYWIFKNKLKNRYPVKLDNLYLSIFLVDMAGNSFNLYAGTTFFDKIAHFHGAGALALLTYILIKEDNWRKNIIVAILIAFAIHSALEVQEYYTDVFFGTHNVNGWGDTIGDLLAGLLGGIVYIASYLLLIKNSASTTSTKN